METTCGIFLIDARDKCLVVHPTGHKPWSWSIPKGRMEAGEEQLETAQRELREETGLNLSDYASFITQVRRLPEVKYTTRSKLLVPFAIWLSITMKEVPLFCNTLVGDRFPENDDFRWVGFRELGPLIHPTQSAVIQHVLAHY